MHLLILDELYFCAWVNSSHFMSLVPIKHDNDDADRQIIRNIVVWFLFALNKLQLYWPFYFKVACVTRLIQEKKCHISHFKKGQYTLCSSATVCQFVMTWK